MGIMKKISILIMFIIVLAFAGCSNSTVDSVTKETTDQLQNLTNKSNKYVLMVKNGHPISYPNSTYGTSFDNFFGYPTWKYFKSTDGIDIVEFTGQCMYQEVQVKARLQFILDVTGGTFEAGALAFNEIPQNQLITAGLFSKIFEDETSKTTEPTVKAETNSIDELNTTAQPNSTVSELEYLPYANDRYGFSINYPSTFITLLLPDNNDGIILGTPDESTKLTVSGINNVLDETPTSIYKDLLMEHSDAAYKKQEGNWMVVSWLEGDNIVYQKSVVGSGSINTFIITYPASQNDYYSPIISKLNSSFKTPEIEISH